MLNAAQELGAHLRRSVEEVRAEMLRHAALNPELLAKIDTLKGIVAKTEEEGLLLQNKLAEKRVQLEERQKHEASLQAGCALLSKQRPPETLNQVVRIFNSASRVAANSRR